MYSSNSFLLGMALNGNPVGGSGYDNFSSSGGTKKGYVCDTVDGDGSMGGMVVHRQRESERELLRGEEGGGRGLTTGGMITLRAYDIFTTSDPMYAPAMERKSSIIHGTGHSFSIPDHSSNVSNEGCPFRRIMMLTRSGI